MQGSNTDNKNKRKFSLTKIFDNKRYVVIISVFIAFIAWMLATANSEDIIRQIDYVKININTEGQVVGDRTLMPFFDEGRDKDSFFINLRVQGPQMYVNKNLTAESFSVSLDMASVDKPGVHSVNVIVKRKDGLDSSVKLLEYEPKTLFLYFDELETAELLLHPQLIREGEEVDKDLLVPEGYLAESPTASLKTVTVTGAAEQIKKIDKIVARALVPDELKKTAVLDAELVALTDSAYPPKYITINTVEGETTPITPRVTVLVKKIYDLDTAIDFGRTIPEDYLESPLKFSVSPSKVKIAIDAERKPGDELIVGLLDFSQIDAKINEFEFQVSKLEEANSLNSYVSVLSEDVKSFKVRVDASNMVKKTLDTPIKLKDNLTFFAVHESIKLVPITESIDDVVVIAPNSAILDTITTSNIKAEIDLSNYDLTKDTIKIDAHLYIDGSKDSWCFGKYPIEVKIIRPD